jgi:mannose-1-phosphate guanylyltransferase
MSRLVYEELLSRCAPVLERGESGHERSGRWALILAGGDGTRLLPMTREIAGDERPKQFCALVGDETLLGQTRGRVARSVSPEKTLFVLTRKHERFYEPALAGVPRRQLVVQPRGNAGTAPAVLYGMLRVSKADPASAVAVFPSDHYVSDDAAFMSHVETAFEAARSREDTVVLLGVEPDAPEAEYGWVEPVPHGTDETPGALRRVLRFWEKPKPEFARGLMERGCLWNSFVMVGRVSAFLELIRDAAPELFERFDEARPALDTPEEEPSMRDLYSRLDEVNFSKHVLEARPATLAVLRVSGVTWSDLGRPKRVLAARARSARDSHSPPMSAASLAN